MNRHSGINDNNNKKDRTKQATTAAIPMVGTIVTAALLLSGLSLISSYQQPAIAQQNMTEGGAGTTGGGTAGNATNMTAAGNVTNATTAGNATNMTAAGNVTNATTAGNATNMTATGTEGGGGGGILEDIFGGGEEGQGQGGG
jgi:hypothetical protein